MGIQRANFSQPYWEYVLPLVCWIGLLPLLLLRGEYSSSFLANSNSSHILYSLISSKTSLYIASGLSISMLSWVTSLVINSHTLLLKRGYLPSLVTVLMGVLGILLTGFSFSYLAVAFLLLGMSNIFSSSRETRSYNYIFNAGFFLGLSFLIDYRVWISFPLLILCLILIRSPKLRDFSVILVGFINVLVLTAGISYLRTDTVDHMSLVRNFFQIKLEDYLSTRSVVFYGSSGILFLLSVFMISGYISSMNNKTKERFRLFLFVLIFSFILNLIAASFLSGLFMTSLMVPAMSLAISVGLLSGKKKWLKMVFSFLILVLVGLWVATFFK